MSRFSKTGNVAIAGTRVPYFATPSEEQPSNEYVIELTQLNSIEPTQKGKTTSFIINGRILESNCEQDPVGSVRSQVLGADKGEITYATLKAILAASGLVDPDDLVGEESEEILEEFVVESPNTLHEDLQGTIVRLYVSRTQNVAKTVWYGRSSYERMTDEDKAAYKA